MMDFARVLQGTSFIPLRTASKSESVSWVFADFFCDGI